MSHGQTFKPDEGEGGMKMGLNVMGGQWKFYDEVWGAQAKTAADKPMGQLEAGQSASANMTDAQMQNQLDAALSKSIY